MMFRAASRVPVRMYRWIGFVCRINCVQAVILFFAIQQNIEPLRVRVFSREFGFVVNTFVWFRHRGDSFGLFSGRPFSYREKAHCSVAAI